MWPSEQLAAEKKAFALELLKQNDPFKAATAVFGVTKPGKCLQVAAEWEKDALVQQFMAELLVEQGEEAFLPTKASLAKRVMDTAEGFAHADNKLKAFRLYAEIMGFIAKPELGNGSKGSGVVAVPLSVDEMKL